MDAGHNGGGAAERLLEFIVEVERLEVEKKQIADVIRDVKSRAKSAGFDVKVPSITSLYRTADWWERYMYDMFGFEFEGHPNLQRLLLYPEFQGFPLRKDYPVRKRQLLVPELDFPDLIRGPGPGPGGAGVPMSQTHVGRQNVDPDAYD